MNKPSYSIDPNEVLAFQEKRVITNLFKGFLIILEDIKNGHDEAHNKLESCLPVEYRSYVQLSDNLSNDKMDLYRKKILDIGNDSWREIENILKQFDIEFKR